MSPDNGKGLFLNPFERITTRKCYVFQKDPITLHCPVLALRRRAQMAFAEYPEHPVTVYHPFEPTPYDALSKVYNAEMSKIWVCPLSLNMV